MSEKVKDVKVSEEVKLKTVEAPVLPYRPRDPKNYSPKIGMIGCGGISASHLAAYKTSGYQVAHFCDLVLERATSRRDEYYPGADISTDYREVLQRSDIGVVDIATHPVDRVQLIEDALKAKKHVLSQKPFVLDIPTGQRLVQLAQDNGVVLAVNHNGRWAPHMSYMREAVRAGLVGDVIGVHAQVHWDHTWCLGTPFEKIEDLVLYDFAIHWFDFLSSLIPDRTIGRVFATKSFVKDQEMKVPMIAQVGIEFDGGQASLVFDAHTKFGALDTTYVAGSHGSLSSFGPNLGEQTLQYFNESGVATPALVGSWFPDGFHGTMGELLSSIEEGTVPRNVAKDNLRSLSLAFAAIASANDRRPYQFGEATELWSPGGKKS